MVAVHSTARGPSLGGCRMWGYDDARAAVRDVLRLSRAMTYKAACAGLPQGGGKGVIVLSPGERLAPAARRDVLLDFAETVEAVGGRYRTAEDVGTSDADMAIIAQGTAHVTGLASGSGDPSPWTALGVQVSIEAACERAFGSPGLIGRRIAVVGLGRVGGHLARLLTAAGADLVVADIDPDRRALAEELGARWLSPDEAMGADCDVLAPCALGAVLGPATIPELRCRAIAGAANNQLASDDAAAELARRGVLWVPDFVANAGGIVNIAGELEPACYAEERAEPAVRAIGDTVRRVLDDAEARGVTPLAAAMDLARARLAPAAA
jgi:leucine dehydrogenase